MEKEFVNPNLHVALVHYPLALLTIGALIELFSFLWRRHGFRAAGRWMILLGALCGIPTALSGIYALSDVARMGLDVSQAGGPWKEVSAASPLLEHQWEMLEDHVWLQSSAALVAVVIVVTWIGCSDLWRRRLHLPLLILLLVSVGLTSAGAWHGGEAVYRHGTGVLPHMEVPDAMRPADQPVVWETPAKQTTTTGPATSATTIQATLPPKAEQVAAEGAATVEQREGGERHGSIQEQIEYFLPPVQTHVIMAGTTVALALAALALSIRKITQGPPVTQVDHIAAALGGPPTLIGGEGDSAEYASPAAVTPEEPQDLAVPRVPAARFWMLSFLLALLTAAGGYIVLASESETWAVLDLWKGIILENARSDNFRQIAHVISGVLIVLLTLLLAALARWAPRSKWALAVFAVVLLAVVAFQVWLGILLLYDTPMGPVRGFN